MNTRFNSISDLDRKIAEAEFRIIALRDKAFHKAVIFARTAETLTGNAELVVGDSKPFDPNFSPRSISMKVPLDLVQETIKLTEDLRSVPQATRAARIVAVCYGASAPQRSA